MLYLACFDFDHTVVDDNSDTWLWKAAPGGTIPAELKGAYTKGRWLDFVNLVLKFLHENAVTVKQIQLLMEQIPWTPGMHALLTFLQQHSTSFHCVILSDANSQFIQWILASRGLQGMFAEVLTNPATEHADGFLEVRPHHEHSCSRCNHNLCKREALQGLLDKQLQNGVQYDKVVYVGDGSNDFCPSTGLRKCDVVMPRVGYALHQLLKESRCTPEIAHVADGALYRPCTGDVEASVVPWTNGSDILQWIETNCNINDF